MLGSRTQGRAEMHRDKKVCRRAVGRFEAQGRRLFQHRRDGEGLSGIPDRLFPRRGQPARLRGRIQRRPDFSPEVITLS